MTRSQARRNIKLYFLFQIVVFHLFWGPILILYINKVGGMSLSEIYLMEAVCVAGFVVLEVPSGALADMIGRRKSILIGSIIMFFEAVLFAWADRPAMIWAGNILWVIGFSMISGADEALFVDSLKLLGKDHLRRDLFGKINYYRYLVTAITSLLAGYLAEIDLRIPMRLDVITAASVCVVAYLFIDPPVTEKTETSCRQYLKTLKSGIGQVIGSRQLIWLICFSVLLSTASKIWFFSYNPYFEIVGLDLTNFGIVFCLLNLVAAFFSRCSNWLSKTFGDRGSIILLLSCLAPPMILMGSWPSKFLIVMIMFQNVIRGYQGPFVKQIFHEYVCSSHRATVGSILSASRGLMEWLTMLGYSSLLLCWSVTDCLQILGWLALGLGIVMLMTYSSAFKLQSE